MTTDPLVTERAVKQPVLILQGDTDMQVTPEQADTLAATMRAAGNKNVMMKRFPATNHLFLADPSGAPQGYATLKDTHVHRDVLGALADWVVRVTK
jgi:dipeptidyl aminopeptidase/acylaminoacyl peptidase